MPDAPFAARDPLMGSGHYDPISIGDSTPAAASCPEHPWWWLVAAAAAGGILGFQLSKAQRPQRRRGR